MKKKTDVLRLNLNIPEYGNPRKAFFGISLVLFFVSISTSLGVPDMMHQHQIALHLWTFGELPPGPPESLSRGKGARMASSKNPILTFQGRLQQSISWYFHYFRWKSLKYLEMAIKLASPRLFDKHLFAAVELVRSHAGIPSTPASPQLNVDVPRSKRTSRYLTPLPG